MKYATNNVHAPISFICMKYFDKFSHSMHAYHLAVASMYDHDGFGLGELEPLLDRGVHDWRAEGSLCLGVIYEELLFIAPSGSRPTPSVGGGGGAGCGPGAKCMQCARCCALP